MGGIIVVREVDAVEEVCPVAGVGKDGCGKALPCQPFVNCFGPFEGSEVLCFVCGDAAGPDGVKVNGEPPAAADVGVGGGGVAPGEALLDAVGPPGEEGRVHLVECDVDAVHIAECVHCSRLLCKEVKVGEVAAVDADIAEGTEFDDVTVGKEEGE
ncbi:hypothetical protein MKMG_00137 [Methanogenium sp. MK-MG]|nr:hypothetical protein MKMG_00137 [Methanogenium sp. MK-MG]